MKYLFALLAVVVAALTLTGCSTFEQQQLYDELIKTYEAATADGVISADERQLLLQIATEYKEAVASTDWQELLMTGAGTLIASIFGVNFMRNRGMPGTTRR